MKKVIALFLTFILCLGLCACGTSGQKPVPVDSPVPTDGTPQEPSVTPNYAVTVTDSAGRKVEIPASITKIAPAGTVATMFLAVVAPEMLVCSGTTISEAETKYIDPSLADLPVTGQLYGGKSTLNLEELLSTDPQIILDIGDKKKGIAEDMDALQEQTGIPCVFLEGDLAHMAELFRTLGSLLEGKKERCEELAVFVEQTVDLAVSTSERIPEDKRVRVMYTSGADGLGTNAKGSSQAQVLDLVGAVNAVEVENVTSKGGGNLISMEQLYLFDPDVILFTYDSIYDSVADEAAWQQVRAVTDGQYYKVPFGPYNWLGSPPSLNMLLGVRWLGNLLYPEYYPLDIVEETVIAYNLLWNRILTEEEALELLDGAMLTP